MEIRIFAYFQLLLSITFFLSFSPLANAASCTGASVPANIPALTNLPPNELKTEVAKPTTVGGVVWVNGTLKAITPDNKERVLLKNSPVFLHDYLVTGKNSMAQVVFTDKTLMTFQESTQFYVKEYNFTAQTKAKVAGKFVMELFVGGFRTITGLISRVNAANYQVKTPVATIAVRGTDYAVYSCKREVYMNRYEGTPIMTNEKGTLELGKDNPYGYVADANRAPIQVREKPAVFDVPLPIVPATIKMVPVSDTTMIGQDKGIAPDATKEMISIDTTSDNDQTSRVGAGGSCYIQGGGFVIRNKQ